MDPAAAQPPAPPSDEGEQAPDTAAAMVDVEVVSVPPGAGIELDGQQVGVAPAQVQLPVGQPVSIVARLRGYQTLTQQVTAEQPQSPLRLALSPAQYVIAVQSSPADVRVIAHGVRVVGPGEILLPNPPRTPVRVIANKPGFDRHVEVLPLSRFEPQSDRMVASYTVELQPRARPAAKMAPTMSPAGATIPPTNTTMAPTHTTVAPAVTPSAMTSTTPASPSPMAPRPAPAPAPSPPVPDNPF